MTEHVERMRREILTPEQVAEIAAGRSVTQGYRPPDDLEPEEPVVGDGARSAALRVIDERSADLDSVAGDRLVELVKRDRHGLDAEYIAAIADPAYERAFAKMLRARGGAHQVLDPDEARAMERVGDAMQMRAMTVGTGSEGGFAVPFALDPTITLTSDGALNPIRSLANVIQITTSEWRGINSQGVTASFVAEATEVSDDSPTLAQPSITPERAQCFVPFSIELGQDWDGLSDELGRLFADSKDVLEAEKFISGSGSGSDEPEGLIAGLAAGSVVETANIDTFALADVYSLQEAVPPRFQPRAGWLSSNPIGNTIYRFVGTGDPDEPPLFSADRSMLLGKPWSEVSTMSTDPTTGGEDILLYGDVRSAYRIVDRIGLTIELVPHLFGANQRPTGERGLYAFWRTSAAVEVDNAVRLLRVKAA